MPATSGAAEVHSTEIDFEVKKDGANFGTCRFSFDLNLLWTGFSSRKSFISKIIATPFGKVTCKVLPEGNNIIFKVDKELALNVPEKTTTFSVLSFNVQMRPVLDPNEWKGPLISARLNLYDVVGVQENFANPEGLMSKLQHPYKIHLSAKWPFAFTNSGLAIFPKYKIIENKHELYKDVAAAGLAGDWAASKGVFWFG